MKIVQLTYSLKSGGAERFVVDMANELNNRFNELMKGGDDFFSNLGRSFFNGFDDSFILFTS